MATRTTVRTTVSRDPALVALLEGRPDYPGASAQLDAADRAWLRSQGVTVPPRAPEVPLHVAARLARVGRKEAPQKKRQGRPRRP